MTEAPAQGDLGFDAGEPDHDRLRRFDADFTPGPIVRQGLVELRKLFVGRYDYILDPSAGAGVFGQQARELWPDAHLTGVEPRQEETPYLERHYCSISTMRFNEWVECQGSSAFPVGLLATNPPFSLFPEFVELGHEVVDRAGAIVLLGLSTWGQSAEGVELFNRFPPALQLRIGGRIGFRGPGNNPRTGKPWGVDQRDYSWWVWTPGMRPRAFNGARCWNTMQLPVLPTAQRTWRVKPGTEEPKALTAAPI